MDSNSSVRSSVIPRKLQRIQLIGLKSVREFFVLHQDKVNNLRPIERETRSLGKKFDIYNTYCTERWTLYAALSQTRGR